MVCIRCIKLAYQPFSGYTRITLYYNGLKMTIDEALKEFKSARQLTILLKMHHSNVNDWRKKGYIPPLTQMKIEQLTGGRVKADPLVI